MIIESLRRSLTCLIVGHDWHHYLYPHGDGWFGAPHYRRECIRCDKDEARVTP